MATINRITNAVMYLGADILARKVEDFDGPVIKTKTSEVKAIGMMGHVSLPSGMEKLEAKFKMNGVYPDVMKQVANMYKKYTVTIRGSVEIYDGNDLVDEQPYECTMMGMFTEFPTGAFKQNDNTEFPVAMNLTYAKVKHNGEDIVEVDFMNQVYKAAGVDLWAKKRANMGL